MGLLQQDPEAWFHAGASDDDLSAEQIEAKIAERLAAKQAKDYALADQIRDELKAAGISLQESREGVSWRRD
jgi:cysteinyl-tRNA synthetase